jgi:hypothetical protein
MAPTSRVLADHNSGSWFRDHADLLIGNVEVKDALANRLVRDNVDRDKIRTVRPGDRS